MLTSAERQKRYRYHGKGDHSLCDPTRCPELGATTTSTPPAAKEPAIRPSEAEVPPVVPTERFGTRGTELWAEMADTKLGPTHRVLLEESCRIADRLDRIDAMLNGREDWIRLRARNDEATEYVVIVDALLAEGRQQATALRGLIAELRTAEPGAKRGPGRPAIVADSPSGSKGAGVADLVARAAARRNSTAS